MLELAPCTHVHGINYISRRLMEESALVDISKDIEFRNYRKSSISPGRGLNNFQGFQRGCLLDRELEKGTY